MKHLTKKILDEGMRAPVVVVVVVVQMQDHSETVQLNLSIKRVGIEGDNKKEGTNN